MDKTSQIMAEKQLEESHQGNKDDKQLEESHGGNEDEKPSCYSPAKGIVLDNIGIEAKQPNSAFVPNDGCVKKINKYDEFLRKMGITSRESRLWSKEDKKRVIKEERWRLAAVRRLTPQQRFKAKMLKIEFLSRRSDYATRLSLYRQKIIGPQKIIIGRSQIMQVTRHKKGKTVVPNDGCLNDEVLIAGSGRKGHAVGDIPGPSFNS